MIEFCFIEKGVTTTYKFPRRNGDLQFPLTTPLFVCQASYDLWHNPELRKSGIKGLSITVFVQPDGKYKPAYQKKMAFA